MSYNQFQLTEAEVDRIKAKNAKKAIRAYIKQHGSEPNDISSFYTATNAELEHYRRVIYAEQMVSGDEDGGDTLKPTAIRFLNVLGEVQKTGSNPYILEGVNENDTITNVVAQFNIQPGWSELTVKSIPSDWEIAIPEDEEDRDEWFDICYYGAEPNNLVGGLQAIFEVDGVACEVDITWDYVRS